MWRGGGRKGEGGGEREGVWEQEKGERKVNEEYQLRQISQNLLYITTQRIFTQVSSWSH